MSEKAVHAGHRARMRERFMKEGLSGFSEHEVLEFLLMFAIPQRDVNPLAHRLIDRFGSLSAVLESSPAELTRVDGVGENAAALLSLMPQLMGYQPMNFPAMADRACNPDHDYAQVTIENVGADPGFVYYPYQILTTPEQLGGAAFVHDAWLARAEDVRKHTLYVMPECDPLSGTVLTSYSHYIKLHKMCNIYK